MNSLADALGLGETDNDRWTEALFKFDAAFYGRREYIPAYEAIGPRVPFHLDADIAPQDKVTRPRTAELTPALQRSLAAFKELDMIVFNPPSNPKTPVASPIPHMDIERTSLESARNMRRLQSARSYYSQLSVERKRLLKRMLGKEYFNYLLKSLGTASARIEHMPNMFVHPVDPQLTKIKVSPALMVNEYLETKITREMGQMRLPAIGKKAVETVDLEQQKYPQIGHIFPLEYFMDHERTQMLLSLMESRTPVKCRVWPTASEHYYQTYECLLKCATYAQYWKACVLESFDEANQTFRVSYQQPEQELGVNVSYSIKWTSEIMLPNEHPKALLYCLQKAQQLRLQYEQEFAVEKAVQIARPLMLQFVPHLPQIHQQLKHADQYPAAIKLGEHELAQMHSDNHIAWMLRTNDHFCEFLPQPPQTQVEHEDLLKTMALSGLVKRNVHQIQPTMSLFCTKPVIVFRKSLEEKMEGFFENNILQLLSKPMSYTTMVEVKQQQDLMTTAKIVAEKKRLKRIGLSVLAKEKEKAVEWREKTIDINPVVDKRGRVHFGAKDFTNALEWLLIAFSKLVRKDFSNSVYQFFCELLQAFGLDVKVDGLTDLTLTEVAKKHGQDLGPELIERIGKFVTLFAESYFLPKTARHIFSLYDILRDEHLLLSLDVELDEQQLDLKFSSDLDLLESELESMLIKWVTPLHSALPARVMSTQNGTEQLLRTLFKELIAESIEKSKDYMSSLRSVFLPLLKTASTIPKIADDPKQYIEQCQDCLESLKRLPFLITSRLAPQNKGIFMMSTDKIHKHMIEWIQRTKHNLVQSIMETMRYKSSTLVTGVENYFLVPVPSNCAEFQLATQRHEEMKSILKKTDSETRSLLLMKEFCNSQSWLQPDEDYMNLMAACQIQERFAQFMDQRELVMANTQKQLRDQTSDKLAAFLNDWENVSEELTRIFTKNVVLPAGAEELMSEVSERENSFLPIRYAQRLDDTKPMMIYEPKSTLLAVYNRITDYKSLAERLRTEIQQINGCEREHEVLEVLFNLDSKRVLLSIWMEVESNLSHWRSTAIGALDFEQIETECDQLTQSYQQHVKEEMPVATYLQKDLSFFFNTQLPLAHRLTNKTLEQVHWRLIRDLFQIDLHLDKSSIDDITKAHSIQGYKRLSNELGPIEETAKKEYSLSKTIADMWYRYHNMPLELEENGRFGITVVKGLGNHINVIESDLLTTSLLLSSSQADKHAPKLRDLEGKLQIASMAMRQWETMQPLMINVHSFFESEEVRRQLFAELRTFKVFKTGFNVLIQNIAKSVTFSNLITSFPDFPTSVAEIRNGLKKAIEDVQGWLGNKRVAFPRLFFISDDDLLALIANSSDPSTIQKQLPKYFCFSKLVLVQEQGKHVITGVESEDGECLTFSRGILLHGIGVEEWLTKLENEIQNSLKIKLQSALELADRSFQTQTMQTTKKLMELPGQLMQLVLQIVRTEQIHQCVPTRYTHSLTDLSAICLNHIVDISTIMRERDELPKHRINALKNLIITDIYYRDWCQEMIIHAINNQRCAAWHKGLQYRFHIEDQVLLVQQNMETAHYGFEYLGSSPRLVWSEAALRGFTSIWSAMHMKMGLTGYGPDSIGKTDIFRDFSRALGRFCILFNCSESVTGAILSRLLTGMIMTGSFLVLTHYDALDEENLTLVLNAISELRDLLSKKDQSPCYFMDRLIKLPRNPKLTCLTTVSVKSMIKPEFTDILKMQMRTVAFTIPDMISWAKSSLYTCGFSDAERLGQHLGSLFIIASDHLSHQPHYDFTLRTMRMVVRLAENFYHEGAKSEKESIVLAIHSYLVPKLLVDDIEIFKGLVQLVFNATPAWDKYVLIKNPVVQTKVEGIAFPYEREMISKTINQFIQMMEYGQHTIVLGHVGVGKTSLIKRVSSILQTKLFTLNAVGLPSGYLLGYEELFFEKGVLESILESETQDPKWIHFDGPWHNSWTDAISSLFQKESGGALSISNGKRIFLDDQTSILIECDSLENSSPGFVGRFNVVFLRQTWSWRTRLESWFLQVEQMWTKIQTSFSFIRAEIKLCCFLFMQPQLNFVEENDLNCSIMSTFQSFLDILESMLFAHFTAEKRATTPLPKPLRECVEDIFHYSMVWSFGSAINHSLRRPFHDNLERLLRIHSSSSRLAQLYTGSMQRSVFELDFEPQSCTWSQTGDEIAFGSLVQRQYQMIVPLLVSRQKNVAFLGPLGTGKTRTGTSLMRRYLDENRESTGLVFSCLLKSDALEFTKHLNKMVHSGTDQVLLESNFVVFVDDLNMSTADEFDTRPFVEFLRSLVDHSGYWSSPQHFKTVAKFSMMTAMDVDESDNFSKMDKLLRHFCSLRMHEQDILEDSRSRYIQTHLGLLSENQDLLVTRVRSIANASLEFMLDVKKHIPHAAEKPFNVFTSHDLESLYDRFLVSDDLAGPVDGLLGFWSQACESVFKDRLSASDEPVYENIFLEIARRHFQFDDLGMLMKLPSFAAIASKAPSREGRKQTPIHSRDLNLFPGSQAYVEKLSEALFRDCNAHAILACHPGSDISLDVVRHAAGEYHVHEFSLSHWDTRRWNVFIRKHLHDVICNEKKTVCCITIFKDTIVPKEFFADVCCIMDGARNSHWWSPKEYEEIVTTIAKQIMPLSVTKSTRSQLIVQDEDLSRQVSSFEIQECWTDRVRRKLSLILRVDTRDKQTLNLLLKFPRIISRSYVGIHKPYQEEDLKQISSSILERSLKTTEYEGLVDKIASMSAKIYMTIKKREKDIPGSGLSVKNFIRSIEMTAHELLERNRTMDKDIQLQQVSYGQLSIVKERFTQIVAEERQRLQRLPHDLEETKRELQQIDAVIDETVNRIQSLETAIRTRVETNLRQVYDQESKKYQTIMKDAVTAYEHGNRLLYGIKKNDLEELKQYVIPSPDLALVADGICMLFEKPLGWPEARKLLSSHTFLERSIAFHPKDFSEKTFNRLRGLIEGATTNFKIKSLPAVKSLWTWLKSLVKLAKVLTIKVDLKPVDLTEQEYMDMAYQEEKELLVQLRKELHASRLRKQDLIVQKKEYVGRLALLNEIFSPESIFNQPKLDNISESQWIQQAFQNGEEFVHFSDEQVQTAHQSYQRELGKLSTLKRNVAKDNQEVKSILEDIRQILGSFTLKGIEEMFLVKESSPLTDAARQTLLQLLKLPSRSSAQTIYQSIQKQDLLEFTDNNCILFKATTADNPLFQRTPFYNSKMVITTAVSPVQACGAVFTVCDLAVALNSYYLKKQRIAGILEGTQQSVMSEKARFDNVWFQVYSSVPEFWTFETILQKFKDNLNYIQAMQTTVRSHLPAISKNPLLTNILNAAESISGGEIGPLESYSCLDPQVFVEKMRKIKIADPETIKRLHKISPDFQQLLYDTKSELKKVYLDLISKLPRNLSSKILLIVGAKNTAKIMRVSKTWAEIIRNPLLWKCFGHMNGWGIVFNYPKQMDWKKYYQTLVLLKKSKMGTIFEVFNYELAGNTGLRALKKMTAFLRRLPDYVKLDKQADRDTPLGMSECVQLELVNDVFNDLEDSFTNFLTREYHDNMHDPELTEAMRFRRVICKCVDSYGTYIKTIHVHALVIEKAAHYKWVNSVISKPGKAMRHVDPQIQMTVPMITQTKDFVQLSSVASDPPECFDVFLYLRELYQALYAFDRGLQMSKNVQFHCRFIRSLDILCERINNRMLSLQDKKQFVPSCAIITSSIKTYGAFLDLETRRPLVEEWKKLTEQYFLLGTDDGLVVPHHDDYSNFLDTFSVRTNLAIILNCNDDMLLLDPNGIAVDTLIASTKHMEMTYKICDVSSAMLQKELGGPFGKNEWVYLVGKIWTPQAIAEVSSWLRQRQNDKKSTTPMRYMLSCPSQEVIDKLDLGLETVDWRCNADILSACLMDQCMQAKRPQFHLNSVGLKQKVEQKETEIQNWYSKILNIVSVESDLDELMMHDIILFQRETMVLDELEKQLMATETENQVRYQPYVKFVQAVMKVWSIVENLRFVCPSYLFNSDILTTEFKESLALFPQFSTHIYPTDCEKALDYLLNRIMTLVGSGLQPLHKICFYFSVYLVKTEYLESFPPKEALGLRSIVKHMLQAKNVPDLCARIEEGLHLQHKNITNLLHCFHLFQNQMQRSKNKSFVHAFVEFVVQLVVQPQRFEKVLKTGILQPNNLSAVEGRERGRSLTTAFESSKNLIFLVTESYQDSRECILELGDSIEDSHLQISYLNDVDKMDDQWLVKFTSASLNKGWVVIYGDPFWLRELPRMLSICQTAKQGFKIWFMLPTHMIDRAPGWIVRNYARIHCDLETFDYWWIFRRISWLDNAYPMAFHPVLMIFFKFYILMTQERQCVEGNLPKLGSSFFRLGSGVINNCIKNTVAPENMFAMLYQIIFDPLALSKHDRARVIACWRQSTAIVQEALGRVAIPMDNWTRDIFDHFLRIFKEELFDPLHICYDIDRLDVFNISMQLVRTLSLQFEPEAMRLSTSKQSIRSELVHLLRLVPPTINVRAIHENASPQKSPFDFYLMQEVNNLLLLIRIIRKDLQATIENLALGTETWSSKNLLDAISRNVVPEEWIKNSHPTRANVREWILWLASRVKETEGMSVSRNLKEVDIRVPVSLRALIRTLMWLKILQSNGDWSLDQTALQIVDPQKAREIDSLVITGIKKLWPKKEDLSLGLIVQQRKENRKDNEHLVQLSEIYEEALFIEDQIVDKSYLSLLVSLDCPGGLHFLEDGIRMNRVFDIRHHEPGLALLDYFGYERVSRPISHATTDETIVRNIEASRHICVYISSTEDTENELEFMYQHVLRDLRKEMKDLHIEIQIVDFRQDSSYATVSLTNKALAAVSQIARSHIFISLLGTKLGPVIVQDKHMPISLQNMIQKGKTMPEIEFEAAHMNPLPYQCRFYARDSSFARSVPKSFRDRYTSETVEELERLQDMGHKMQKSTKSKGAYSYSGHFTHVKDGTKVCMGGLESFGERFKSELRKDILELIYQPITTSNLVPSYHGPERLIKQILNAGDKNDETNIYDISKADSRTFVISGEQGSGKSALLSHLCNEFAQKEYLVLYSFVRSWSGSFDVYATIRRFCLKLMMRLNAPFSIFPTSPDSLRKIFISLIRQAVQLGTKIAIIVDGIDRMSAGRMNGPLEWIPKPADLGSDAFESTIWIMSTTTKDTFDQMQDIHPNTFYCELNGLELSQKMAIVKDESKRLGLRWEQRDLEQLYHHPGSDSPLFLTSILREAKEKQRPGELATMNLNYQSISHIFFNILENFEYEFGFQNIRLLVSYLSFARNGLREPEILGIMQMTVIQWNLMYRVLEPYLKRTTTGFIMMYCDQISADARSRYARHPRDAKTFHRQLADYYITSRREHGLKNAIRMIDIPYHLFQAQAPIEEISAIICTIDYMTAAFDCNVAHELDKFFIDAIKIAAEDSKLEIRTRLTEYFFFVERNYSHLKASAKIAFPLALDLPKGVCPKVKQEAQEIYDQQQFQFPYLRCVSVTQDQLELASIGNQDARICLVSVVNLSIGRRLLVICANGTTSIWDPETFIKERNLIEFSLASDVVVECAVSIVHNDHVCMATEHGHYHVFDIIKGQKLYHMENQYPGGMIFYDEDCIWAVVKRKLCSLDLKTKESKILMKCPKILAKSMDGSRLALLSTNEPQGIVIWSTKTKKAVCKFKESQLSEQSKAVFSFSNDLIACSLTTGDIFVWRIDNLSRVCLIKIPDEKVIAMAMSLDESTLFFSTREHSFGIADLQTGSLVKILGTGSYHLHNMCIALTKGGQERFFLVADQMLATCFSPKVYSAKNLKKEQKLILPRHKSAIIKVLQFKEDGKIVTVSKDGKAVVHQFERNRYTPQQQVQLENIVSVRLSQQNYLVMTCTKAAVIYDIVNMKEVLRVPHDIALKDALLVNNRDDFKAYTLYTWSYVGEVYAWKITGKESLFYSYQKTPLFKTHSTLFPKNIITPQGLNLAIVNYTKVEDCDAISGEALNTYHTRNREAIVACSQFQSKQKNSILFATKTSVFLNQQCISYGGSLGDTIQIDQCQQDPTGQLIAYSGVDWSENVLGPMSQESHFDGIVVVLQSAPTNRRISRLSHEDARVLHWQFSYDGKYIVTCASDKNIRIWDIYKQHVVCSFPLKHTPTALELSANSYQIFIGDDSGDFIAFEFIHGQLS
ncbi:hypothetical protein EDD86DRAFT_269734 [Gorgonomyces haynaldii]|nr:hypothetical protein EDD86DRAFT_269734 [Gorgonomyces haynaldii]